MAHYLLVLNITDQKHDDHAYLSMPTVSVSCNSCNSNLNPKKANPNHMVQIVLFYNCGNPRFLKCYVVYSSLLEILSQSSHSQACLILNHRLAITFFCYYRRIQAVKRCEASDWQLQLIVLQHSCVGNLYNSYTHAMKCQCCDLSQSYVVIVLVIATKNLFYNFLLHEPQLLF